MFAATLTSMFTATLLSVVATTATAHAPHDEIAHVVASPAYSTDRTVFMISRGQPMRSTDGGANWTEMVRGIDRPHSQRLAVSPADPMTAYLVALGGVYRSTNKGATWTATAFGSRHDIADIVVSPRSASIVIAALTTGGLYRTTDGGQSWTTTGSFGKVTALSAVAGGNGRFLVGDDTGAVYFSDNDGSSWTRATGIPSAITAITAIGAATDATTVFVGTVEGRLFRSANRGSAFTGAGVGLPAEGVTGIAPSPAYGSDATLWVSTTNGVHRSVNGGLNFSPRSDGLTGDPQAAEVGRPNIGGVAAASGPSGMVLFAAGFDGLFRTDDGADHWREIQTQTDQIVGIAVSPAYANDGTVIATTYVKGAYLSNDRGTTWSGRHVGLTQFGANKFSAFLRLHNAVFSPNYATDGTIFTASPSQLLKSTDRGASWARINIAPSGSVQPTRLVLATSPAWATTQTIFGGSAEGDVWRSTAGGAAGTWTRLSNVGARVRSIVVSPSFPADPTLVVGAANGVHISVNDGATWTPTGPQSISMVAMSPAYVTDGTVFAGTASGLYVTRNKGSTWTKIVASPLSATARVEAVSVSPNFGNDGTVLVSVRGRGLYRSTDGGHTFSGIGLTTLFQRNHLIADYDWPTAAPIQFSPAFATDRTIFAFAGNYIMQSTDSGSTWTERKPPPASAILLPPVISAAPGTVTVVEGALGTQRVVRIPFDLSHPYASDVTVHWQTVDLAGDEFAVSTGDFSAGAGTLTFPKGSMRQFADVVVDGDDADEFDERIVVALSEATNATVGGFYGLGFGVITDDDPLPVVVAGSATLSEGDTATSVLSIPVTLSAPSNRTVTVGWATHDFQASSGDDFVPASGTLTFLPGETEKTVDVTIVGDTVLEPDEHMLVALSNPGNAAIGGFWGLGSGLIVNDDPPPG